MTSDMLKKMMDAGVIKASVLDESPLFDERDSIQTDLHILNIAFSGSLRGGIQPGLITFAGESKSFKTLLSLYCMKAYLDKYPGAVGLLYDSEFGTTPEYVKSLGIDPTRVLHIPIEHIEQLKFDLVKRLEAINRGERVFIMVDSIGNLASKKEVEDATEEKSVADMTRAKALKSLFRIITPHLTIKNIPMVIVNHVYDSMSFIPETIVGGGRGSVLSSNAVFIITKAQQKEGTEISGYKFTINIYKSRSVREKAKFPFTVFYEEGIDRFSGLFDLAVEYGIIKQVKNGWYAYIEKDSTEAPQKLFRRKELVNNDEFYIPILANEGFSVYIESHYKLGVNPMVGIERIENE